MSLCNFVGTCESLAAHCHGNVELMCCHCDMRVSLLLYGCGHQLSKENIFLCLLNNFITGFVTTQSKCVHRDHSTAAVSMHNLEGLVFLASNPRYNFMTTAMATLCMIRCTAVVPSVH